MDELTHLTMRPALKTLDRIATALERLVEIAEGAEVDSTEDFTPDLVVDVDGKLMHVTAMGQRKAMVGGMSATGIMDLSAYCVAHDPDTAAREVKQWWMNSGYVGITNIRVTWDD